MVASPTSSQHYDLVVLAVDIPDSDAPEALASLVDESLASFVDKPRANSLLTLAQDNTLSSPAYLDVSIDAVSLRIWRSGDMEQSGERGQLRDFLVESYACVGWEMFDALELELAAIVNSQQAANATSDIVLLALDLSQMVQSIEIELSRQIADFLASFENAALAGLDEALNESAAAALDIRARYLTAESEQQTPSLKRGDDGALDPLVVLLQQDIEVIVGLRDALAEHGMLYDPLANATLLGRALDTPISLASLMPPPAPDDVRNAFGPLLGPQLESWFQVEINDYVKGRNALLRAMGMYMAKARQRHSILDHLVDRFASEPDDTALAQHISDACSEVETAIVTAKALRASGKLSALNASMAAAAAAGTPDDSPYFVSRHGPDYLPPAANNPVQIDNTYGNPAGFESRHGPAFAPAPARGPDSNILEQGHFGDLPRPELWLGALLGRRGSLTGGDDPLVSALPAVTIWDIDALFCSTWQRLQSQGRLGGIEQTALRQMNVESDATRMLENARDIAISLSLSVAASFAGGPLGAAGVDAVIAVMSVIYEQQRYSTLQVLAGTEALAPVGAARRILLRDPAILPLLLAYINVVGDVAGVLRLARLVKLLTHAQLLLCVLAAAESTDINVEALLDALEQQGAEK